MTPLTSAAKAVMDLNRVRILSLLRAGELCVCELCDALEVTQSTLSTHLRVLREAALVIARREGKWSYYRIAPPAMRLVEFLFKYFAASLAADRKLRRDAGQLKHRLALRKNGACCVGYACDQPTKGKAPK